MAQALAAGILIGQSRAGILDTMADQAKFISEEAKGQARYAFRTLPDILLSGSLFLTFILGWQPALASFAAGIITTGLAQGFLSDLLRTQSPSLARAGGAYTLSLHDALPISEERRVGKECNPLNFCVEFTLI